MIKKERKKSHKHIWQFVKEEINIGSVEVTCFKFVCECGAVKKVVEKEV